MIQFILMDIEGTTTSISFVHEVLFPYASKHLASFVRKHLETPAVQEVLISVKATVKTEEQRSLSNEEAIQQLLDWIKEDRKHTALKALQGYMWKDGYETGQYTGHMYADVLPVLKSWTTAGKQLGIYSSGSVAAQQLLFQYSDEGDIRPLLSAYFDTTTGHKKETASYLAIKEKLGLPAEAILFLSDIEAELDAAKGAGYQTIQLVRPGTTASLKHNTVADFSEIEI